MHQESNDEADLTTPEVKSAVPLKPAYLDDNR